MGKQKLNIADWFPHFIPKKGTRMKILRQRYGLQGYAAYFILLEYLTTTENHFLDFTKQKTKLAYQSEVEADEERFTQIMNSFLDLEIIDQELWLECSIVWCQDLVDSLKQLYSKRGRELPLRPPIRAGLDTTAPHSGAGNTHSIVKDSIVNLVKESIVSPPKADLTTKKEIFSNHCRSGEFKELLSKEEIEKFVSYWTEHNDNGKVMRFEMKKNQPFNTKRRMITWRDYKKNYGSHKNSGASKVIDPHKEFDGL